MIIVNRIRQNEGKGLHCIMYNLVPDPDLQGEGGGEERTQENFFPALRASVWSKNKRGGGGGWGPALDPPL